MEVNRERAEAARECLEYNSQMNTVYVTSDLNCFGDKSDAVNHGRGLDEKTVDVFNRDEDGGMEQDIVSTYLGTNAANTIPDAGLAKAKKAGGAKAQGFAKTKKPAAKDPAAKYGTDGEDSVKPKKAAKSKAAKPAVEPEKPADPATDPSTNTDTQQ